MLRRIFVSVVSGLKTDKNVLSKQLAAIETDITAAMKKIKVLAM